MMLLLLLLLLLLLMMMMWLLLLLLLMMMMMMMMKTNHLNLKHCMFVFLSVTVPEHDLQIIILLYQLVYEQKCKKHCNKTALGYISFVEGSTWL
jgi:hypothetical protein